jgi:zinc transporter ZupT
MTLQLKKDDLEKKLSFWQGFSLGVLFMIFLYIVLALISKF